MAKKLTDKQKETVKKLKSKPVREKAAKARKKAADARKEMVKEGFKRVVVYINPKTGEKKDGKGKKI